MAAVQPIDDGQRPVCPVADRKHVRKEPSLRQTKDGPCLLLISGRRVTGSNPQVSRRDRHRVCRLAKVVLQQSGLPVVLGYRCDDTDRCTGPRDVPPALPHLRQLNNGISSEWRA